MIVEIARTFRIEAARRLPRLPASHPCSRVHGHGFTIELVLSGPVDPELGWLVDYDDIARAWQPVGERLDHAYLNDVPGLENPTSEHLARWVLEALVAALPALVAVHVAETPTTRATYRRPEPA